MVEEGQGESKGVRQARGSHLVMEINAKKGLQLTLRAYGQALEVARRCSQLSKARALELEDC